jgi:hypothetical protein
MVRAVQGLWARPLSGFGVRRRRAEGCSIIRINRAAWRVAAAKRFYGGMGASYRLRHPAPGTSEIPRHTVELAYSGSPQRGAAPVEQPA